MSPERGYIVFCGAVETMHRIARRGARALNPRTMKWQTIDQTAKYEVVDTGNGCADFVANVDLRAIANKKGLIL